jgi:hypothetical protein
LTGKTLLLAGGAVAGVGALAYFLWPKTASAAGLPDQTAATVKATACRVLAAIRALPSAAQAALTTNITAKVQSICNGQAATPAESAILLKLSGSNALAVTDIVAAFAGGSGTSGLGCWWCR